MINEIVEVFRLALKNLSLHVMRSALTTLGIIFGVAAVISMVSISEGARFEALEYVKNLGINNITVSTIKPQEQKVEADTETQRVSEYGLTFADFDSITNVLTQLDDAVTVRDVRKNVFYKGYKIITRVLGTAPEYLDIINLGIAKGRFITDADMFQRKNVAVLGGDVAEEMFPYEEPVGKIIRVENKPFQVVGVLRSRGAKGSPVGALTTTNVDRNIYIPMDTALVTYGLVSFQMETGSINVERVELDQILLRVKDASAVIDSAALVRRTLEMNHQDKDYEITVPLELLRQQERTQAIFNIVMISIAGISLIVGGIGIMNIMLATVTERTREIGIRRALGARKKDIILQFLVETVVLSLMGGLLGIFFGVTISLGIAAFAGWKIVVTFVSVLISFTISVGIGIIFGVYPALKAAEMDPIEALRHE